MRRLVAGLVDDIKEEDVPASRVAHKGFARPIARIQDRFARATVGRA